MKIVAVTNQKGGVGKTTTAINVGNYLAARGRSVLLVDIDPQANTTAGLGYEGQEDKYTTGEVLLNPSLVADAIIETQFHGLKLIAAEHALANTEVELVNELGREQRLKQALAHLQFDIVLIDCPPALNVLTINALTAADYVLIPVQTEYYALEGLSKLLETIGRVRQALNPDLEILGLVMTMVDRRTTLARDVERELKQSFASSLFKTVIPRNIRLAEAPSHGLPIENHDRWSKGARRYKELAGEIDRRLFNKKEQR